MPLSVDSGDLVAPYMPTVFNGHQIVGSLVCSRFLQYVYNAPFLFQGLTWLKDKNARVRGATWMHLLGYRSTLAVLHGFKSLQNTDA